MLHSRAGRTMFTSVTWVKTEATPQLRCFYTDWERHAQRALPSKECSVHAVRHMNINRFFAATHRRECSRAIDSASAPVGTSVLAHGKLLRNVRFSDKDNRTQECSRRIYFDLLGKIRECPEFEENLGWMIATCNRLKSIQMEVKVC